jgi:hypothetical protein
MVGDTPAEIVDAMLMMRAWDGYPEAHLQVYGKSPALQEWGGWDGTGELRRLHFPVGGRRFPADPRVVITTDNGRRAKPELCSGTSRNGRPAGGSDPLRH